MGRRRRGPRGQGDRAAGTASPGTAAVAAAAPRAPRLVWYAAGLAALTLLVYGGAWSFAFVQFDDPLYVTQNPHLANGLTWASLCWAFTSGYATNWHPVTWLSHLIDVQLFGLAPGPPHTVNLLLHLANTLLLFWFLAASTGAPGRGAVVAALFAVHPLHVESVAWVSERKDVLSTFFWMLAMCAYLRYARQPDGRRYAVVVTFTALGLMAKPMVVTLPFVLLLLDWWPLQRAGRGWWPLIREKLPLIALAAASSIATVAAQRSGGAVVRLEIIPLALRVETALTSYVTYLGRTIWPTDLYMYYPYPVSVPDWQTAACAAALLAGTAAAWIWRRRGYPAVGWLWYVGTLVPVIGFVQVGRQALADRYTYIPLVGVFVLAVWAVADVISRRPARRALAPILAAVTIVPLGVAARAQAAHWRNDATLWTHALQTAAGLDHRRATLAVRYLLEEGSVVPLQTLLFSRSGGASVFPPLARQYLGRLFARHEQWDDAVTSFREAIALGPNVAEFRSDLAGVYARQGKAAAAVDEYREALRLDPAFAQAHHDLGLLLAGQGRTEEAVRELAETVRLRPDLPDAHRNLAVALAKLGRVDEAIAELREALRLRPGDEAVRQALAAYERQRGRSGM